MTMQKLNNKYYILGGFLALFLIGFITFVIVLAVNGFDPLPIDVTVRDFAYQIRGDKFGFMFWFNRLVSELAFVYFIAIIVVIIGFITKLGLPTLILAGGELVTYLSTTIIKLFIKRERPIADLRWMNEISPSFPSAHSSTVVFVYVILAYFAIRYCKKNYVRIIAPIVALVIIPLVGCSRVILGVHYFTDVLAGYLIGGAIAMAFIIISEICISKNFNFLNKWIKTKLEKNN